MCVAGGEQSGQATAVLDRKSAGLVYQRGGGVPAAQHRRRGEPVLQLSSCPTGDDSEPHRRRGGGGPASGEPLYGAAPRLLAAHQLTDIQRVEQLFNLPPLGAQKPSELLAEMLRLCPRGQENNAFFNCLFLNKLPRELRILLSEAEMADKQALGARADSHAGSGFQQAFPRGHWSFLQHPPTSFFSTCLGPEAVWPGGSAHTLLGETPGAASIPGSRFFLEISFGRCSFPHIGC